MRDPCVSEKLLARLSVSTMLRWLFAKLRRREEEWRNRAHLTAELLKLRLTSPNFDAIPRHFGKPISDALRRLYSNSGELLKECVTKQPPGTHEGEGIFVCWYIPLDEEAIADQWHRGDGFFDFADDGTASRYTVDPTDDDAEMHYFQHEDQTLHPTGVKIRDLLSLPEG